MEQTIEKPPWKQLTFYKTKPYNKANITYGDFLLNIPTELFEKKNEIKSSESIQRSGSSSRTIEQSLFS